MDFSDVVQSFKHNVDTILKETKKAIQPNYNFEAKARLNEVRKLSPDVDLILTMVENAYNKPIIFGGFLRVLMNSSADEVLQYLSKGGDIDIAYNCGIEGMISSIKYGRIPFDDQLCYKDGFTYEKKSPTDSDYQNMKLMQRKEAIQQRKERKAELDEKKKQKQRSKIEKEKKKLFLHYAYTFKFPKNTFKVDMILMYNAEELFKLNTDVNVNALMYRLNNTVLTSSCGDVNEIVDCIRQKKFRCYQNENHEYIFHRFLSLVTDKQYTPDYSDKVTCHVLQVAFANIIKGPGSRPIEIIDKLSKIYANPGFLPFVIDIITNTDGKELIHYFDELLLFACRCDDEKLFDFVIRWEMKTASRMNLCYVKYDDDLCTCICKLLDAGKLRIIKKHKLFELFYEKFKSETHTYRNRYHHRDINMIDMGCWIIAEICKFGDVKLLQEFLANTEININYVHQKNYVIVDAIDGEAVEMVNYLLSLGLREVKSDGRFYKRNAVEEAIESGNVTILKALLRAGYGFEKTYLHRYVIDLIKKEKYEMVRFMKDELGIEMGHAHVCTMVSNKDFVGARWLLEECKIRLPLSPCLTRDYYYDSRDTDPIYTICKKYPQQIFMLKPYTRMRGLFLTMTYCYSDYDYEHKKRRVKLYQKEDFETGMIYLLCSPRLPEPVIRMIIDIPQEIVDSLEKATREYRLAKGV